MSQNCRKRIVSSKTILNMWIFDNPNRIFQVFSSYENNVTDSINHKIITKIYCNIKSHRKWNILWEYKKSQKLTNLLESRILCSLECKKLWLNLYDCVYSHSSGINLRWQLRNHLSTVVGECATTFQEHGTGPSGRPSLAVWRHHQHLMTSSLRNYNQTIIHNPAEGWRFHPQCPLLT